MTRHVRSQIGRRGNVTTSRSTGPGHPPRDRTEEVGRDRAGVAAGDKASTHRRIGDVGEGASRNIGRRNLQDTAVKGVFRDEIMPESHLRRRESDRKRWRVQIGIGHTGRIVMERIVGSGVGRGGAGGPVGSRRTQGSAHRAIAVSVDEGSRPPRGQCGRRHAIKVLTQDDWAARCGCWRRS
jgi:hypothetical protein